MDSQRNIKFFASCSRQQIQTSDCPSLFLLAAILFLGVLYDWDKNP